MIDQEGAQRHGAPSFVRHSVAIAGSVMALLLGGCSLSTEDVRITFCKDLLAQTQAANAQLEWDEPVIEIHGPSHAITRLTLTTTTSDGATSRTAGACWFAREHYDYDPPSAVANPIEGYKTLPYAMSIDGRRLSDAEVRQAVNAEQERRGRALIETLRDGASGVAEQVRAGIGG
jgi:hypothetical protein